MRVYDTPSGRYICNMTFSPISKDINDCRNEIYSIDDLSTIIDIIRKGCGDQFADDLSTLLEDYLYCNTQALEYFAEELDEYERHESDDDSENNAKMLEIKRLLNKTQALLKVLTFGQTDKYKDVFEALARIQNLCDS